MSDDGQRVDAVQLIARVRGAAGPDMIPSRLAAEEEARKVLEEADGRMTVEHAYELAQLLNRGSWGGSLKHNRFAPAFSTRVIKAFSDEVEARLRRVSSVLGLEVARWCSWRGWVRLDGLLWRGSASEVG